MSVDSQSRTLTVCICTCRRAEQLERLLVAIERNAKVLESRAPGVAIAAGDGSTLLAAPVAVGVALVDDDPAGSAREIAERWSQRFERGVSYVCTGSGSISVARNAAIDLGIAHGELMAWIDDDCEPCDEWLAELVGVTDRFASDGATGWCEDVPPPGAPRWLVEGTMLERPTDVADGSLVDVAATKNFLVRTAWMRDHPQHRFDPSLGRLGGEDMVFFYRAIDDGLHVRYAAGAKVFERVPPHRLTYRYRLMRELWMGNSEYVTNTRTGRATRGRMALRGAKRIARAAVAPVGTLRQGKGLQLRSVLTTMARGTGILVGCAGIEMRHH